MKGEREGEIFGLDENTSWNSTVVFSLFGVGKHLKLDKKLIRLIVVIGIVSISSPPIPNRHFP